MLFLKIKSINVLFNGSLVLQQIKHIKKSKSFVFIKKKLFFDNNISIKQNFLTYKNKYLK